MYTEEQVIKYSTAYFNGDEMAAKVFANKYALRNDKDEFLELNPNDMHLRIAKEFARIELKKFKTPLSAEVIHSALKGFKRIIPQGSPMYGIGNKYQISSLSNCYLLESPLDSYAGIMRTDEQLVNISKRRGGVGIDLDNLRPADTKTNNAARSSSGVTSFMERYSNSIREVCQSGRRGALLLSLSVHHPDILSFATIKNDNTKVTGANISVKLSQDFMDAVKNDGEYELRFPVDSKTPRFSKKVKAKKVWDVIIDSAWNRAEPGLLMWDNVLKYSPSDIYEEYRSRGTNPCSEINLSWLDSCRLLCLNLLSYVSNPFTKDAKFEYRKFFEDAKLAQRLMDDMVDLESEKIGIILKKIESDPEPDEIKRNEYNTWKQILKFNNEGRRTGTGITALGDALAALGIVYSSEESIDVTEKIYRTLKLGCYSSSVEMARELGHFKIFDAKKEVGHPFFERFKSDMVYDNDGTLICSGLEVLSDMLKYGRRNIAITTTAPTGTVSIMTQTTSGIEPLFMMSYTRRRKINPDKEKSAKVDFVDQNGDKWEESIVYHQTIKKWMEISGETDLTKSPWYGCCAEDIDWINRVKLQAAAQRHVCHSISSTINLPEDVSKDTISQIYQTACDAGLKGITVYRKNCRTGVLVETKKTDDGKPKIVKNNAPERPRTLECDIHFITAKSTNYFVAVGLLNKEPYEVFIGRNTNSDGELIIKKSRTHGFIHKVKKGEYNILDKNEEQLICIQSTQCDEHEESIARMTSVALRHGADIQFVTESLLKTRGELASFSKTIARALKKYIPDGRDSGQKCPECSLTLKYSEGCVSCSCGYSKCG